MKKDSKFIHFNGAYHSDYQQGILWYLHQSNPGIKSITISTHTQVDIEKFDKEIPCDKTCGRKKRKSKKPKKKSAKGANKTGGKKRSKNKSKKKTKKKLYTTNTTYQIFSIFLKKI